MKQGWCQAFRGPTLHYVRGEVTLCGKSNVNANAAVTGGNGSATGSCAKCREVFNAPMPPLGSAWVKVEPELLAELHAHLEKVRRGRFRDPFRVKAPDGTAIDISAYTDSLQITCWHEAPRNGFGGCGYGGSCMSKGKVDKTIRGVLRGAAATPVLPAKAAPRAVKASGAKRGPVQRATVLGHPVTHVIAAMGKLGLPFVEAMTILTAHGAGGTPSSTVRTFLGKGRAGTKPAAPLTAEQLRAA